MALAQEKCIPCHSDVGKLEEAEASALLGELNGWVIAGEALERGWKFKNFVEAQAFVNQVGDIAEEVGHHPDISFGWGYAQIRLLTHSVNGLTRADFVLAAKIDVIRWL